MREKQKLHCNSLTVTFTIILHQRALPLLWLIRIYSDNLWTEMVFLEKKLKFLVVKRSLIVAKTKNIGFFFKNDSIVVRLRTENGLIGTSRVDEILQANLLRFLWFLPLYSLNSDISSNNSNEKIAKLTRFCQVIFMTGMKTIKRAKCHNSFLHTTKNTKIIKLWK